MRRIQADRAQRERDLTADPQQLSANELAAAIYRLQGMLDTRDARLYGRVDTVKQTRLEALVAERQAREGAAA